MPETTPRHDSGAPAGEIGAISVLLAQDKGGPSKGDFLNNKLCSYTVLYLCNEINGMCRYITYHSGK